MSTDPFAIDELLGLMTKQIVEVINWSQADRFVDSYKKASANARGLFQTAAIKLAARAEQLCALPSSDLDQPELPDPAARFLEFFRRAMAGESVRWPALLRGLGQDESDRLGAMLLREFPQRVFPMDYAAVLSKAAGDKAAPPAPSVGRLRRVLLTVAEYNQVVMDWQGLLADLGLPPSAVDADEYDAEESGAEWDATRRAWVITLEDDSFAEVPLGSGVPWHERPAR